MFFPCIFPCKLTLRFSQERVLKLKSWRKQTSLKIQFYYINRLKQHKNPKKVHMTRSIRHPWYTTLSCSSVNSQSEWCLSAVQCPLQKLWKLGPNWLWPEIESTDSLSIIETWQIGQKHSSQTRSSPSFKKSKRQKDKKSNRRKVERTKTKKIYKLNSRKVKQTKTKFIIVKSLHSCDGFLTYWQLYWSLWSKAKSGHPKDRVLKKYLFLANCSIS